MTACLGEGRVGYRAQVSQLVNKIRIIPGSTVYGNIWYFSSGSHCPDGEGLAILISSPTEQASLVAEYGRQLGSSWTKSSFKGDTSWLHYDGNEVKKVVVITDENQMKLWFKQQYSELSTTGSFSPTLYILHLNAFPVCQ